MSEARTAHELMHHIIDSAFSPQQRERNSDWHTKYELVVPKNGEISVSLTVSGRKFLVTVRDYPYSR